MKSSFDLPGGNPGQGNADFARRLVDYLFDFSGPKFLFDDIYHFGVRHYQKHRNNRNMLPDVKLMVETIAEFIWNQNQKTMMVPEAITNGPLYYAVAKLHEDLIRDHRNGRLTTYRMGESLNKDELAILTEKNKNSAMRRLEGLHKLFPNATIISPTGMEAMLKTLNSEPGFSNRQSLRDEDFESFWIAMCYLTNLGGFSDVVASSRNGNFETFALFNTRYGNVPFRPKGDTAILFPNGDAVTPYDYLSMLYAHLADVVPNGFTSDLALKMAMRMVMLEEMRTTGMAHPQWGPLNKDRMHPGLRDLDAAHDRKFALLKDEFLAFAEAYNLRDDLGDLFGFGDVDGLQSYYDRCQADRVFRKAGLDFAENLPVRTADIGAKLDMHAALAETELDETIALTIPYQLDGDFFGCASRLFDERSFKNCSPVEKLALRAFMGLLETPQPPLVNRGLPGDVLLFLDRRGGPDAQSYAEAHGMSMPEEARGVKASFHQANFDAIVKTANIEKTDRLADRLKRGYPKSRVISLENIEHNADNFHRNRHAFTADGGDRLTGTAKIAYGEEMLRRLGRIALFDQSWENRPVTTYLRLHARKIQLGLVNRPVNMPRHGLIVGDIDEAKPGNKPFEVKSLIDDVRAMSSYMRQLVAAGTEDYPRHVVKGLIELVAFADLYYSDTLNRAAAKKEGHGAVDWQSVPSVLTRGLEQHKEEFLKLKAEAKQMVLQHGMNAVTLEDLEGDLASIDPDYADAKRSAQGNQAIAKSRRPRESSVQIIRGLDSAMPR